MSGKLFVAPATIGPCSDAIRMLIWTPECPTIVGVFNYCWSFQLLLECSTLDGAVSKVRQRSLFAYRHSGNWRQLSSVAQLLGGVSRTDVGPVRSRDFCKQMLSRAVQLPWQQWDSIQVMMHLRIQLGHFQRKLGKLFCCYCRRI
jgi:hypothetical protein